MRIYLTGASGATLGVERPDLTTMLGRLRAELENSWSFV